MFLDLDFMCTCLKVRDLHSLTGHPIYTPTQATCALPLPHTTLRQRQLCQPPAKLPCHCRHHHPWPVYGQREATGLGPRCEWYKENSCIKICRCPPYLFWINVSYSLVSKWIYFATVVWNEIWNFIGNALCCRRSVSLMNVLKSEPRETESNLLVCASHFYWQIFECVCVHVLPIYVYLLIIWFCMWAYVCAFLLFNQHGHLYCLIKMQSGMSPCISCLHIVCAEYCRG